MYSVELYARVRHACHVEGMSIREAARAFGLHRDTVRKMLRFSIPPGYQRSHPRARPKLDPFMGVIDHIVEGDWKCVRRQCQGRSKSVPAWRRKSVADCV